MQIASYELAQYAEYLSSELKKIREKIKFYSEDEYQKFKGSNFSLEIPENDDIVLIKITRVLRERENSVIDTDLAKKLKEKYSDSKNQFSNFDNLLDEIYKKEKGSLDDAFFYVPFSRWFEDLFIQMKSIYLMFLKEFDIQEIISNKAKYEEIVKNANSKENELQKILNSAKKKSDELLLQIEQTATECKISDIKTFYSKLLEETTKENKIYSCFFYITFTVLGLILISLFIFLPNIYNTENKITELTRSVISFTFLGVLSFLINDFRKRMNITKNIIDELKQKEIVVDTYTSLLSRITDFDDETKKKYHDKIIQNIIDTLLVLKNHGYMSKNLNQDTPIITSKIIEEFSNIVKK